MTPATTRVAWVMELAARRPSDGTTWGISAPRAGVKNVPIDDWTKASTTSSGTRSALADEHEAQDHDGPQDVGRDHDPAPVEAVGVGPGHEADGQRRDGQGDGHRGQGQGRAGQLVDQQEQGQHGQAVADVGDGLGRPQPPEVGQAKDVAGAHRRAGGRWSQVSLRVGRRRRWRRAWRTWTGRGRRREGRRPRRARRRRPELLEQRRPGAARSSAARSGARRARPRASSSF